MVCGSALPCGPSKHIFHKLKWKPSSVLFGFMRPRDPSRPLSLFAFLSFPMAEGAKGAHSGEGVGERSQYPSPLAMKSRVTLLKLKQLCRSD